MPAIQNIAENQTSHINRSSTIRVAGTLLRRDGGTQPRAAINLDVACEYGDAMKSGAKFPPVVAFYDGTDYWLADGFHRVEGAFSVGVSCCVP